MTADAMFDFDSDVDTHDIPLPTSDSVRYLTQYDAAALDHCSLSKWEHHSPGALAALQMWASARNLKVVVRDCRRNASCVAHQVEATIDITITVYVREPGVE